MSANVMKIKDSIKTKFIQWLIYIALSGYVSVRADYACVCNQIALVSVYPSKSGSVTPTGSLNYQECKEFLAQNSDSNWFSINYLQQVGYVKNDPSVLLDMCPGSPPASIVGSSVAPNRTATTSHSTTSTHIHVTTHNHVTTQIPSTAQTHVATQNHVTTSVQAQTTRTNLQDGDTSKCPPNILARATGNTAIGQFGRKCYILGFGERPTTWWNAEQMCSSTGGHLVHIENAAEQKFVTDFVRRYSPNHAIWLGLNDIVLEGYFTWTSGGSSSYFHWDPYLASTFDNYNSDCVILNPHNGGLWDDIHCGQHIFFQDYGVVEKVMCQYEIHSPVSIVG